MDCLTATTRPPAVPTRTVASADGTPIRYAALGEGPPLLLLHGFTDRLESWVELGYAAGLPGRRLILMDARGHGESGRPVDPAAYRPGCRAADILAVLDAAGVTRADVAGYSMGGWNALTLLRHAPHRVGRLVIGGAHAFAQDMSPLRRLIGGGLEAWSAWAAGQSDIPADAMLARLLRNDPAALAACVAEDREDQADALAGARHPVLVYAGALDPLHPLAARTATLPPDGRFVSLDGLNHVTAWLRADRALPQLRSFLGG